MNNIETLINRTMLGTGDSDQHLLSLFTIALSSRGKVFIELGVRDGNTSIPLMEAAKLTGGILYSVDINPNPIPDCLCAHWKYYQLDAIRFLETWENYHIDSPDIVFVDDWHSYVHVKKELEILDRIISPSTIVLLHDLMYGNSQPVYHTDLTLTTGQWAEGGPYRAVAELNPQFWEFSTLPWNHGLTILRKKYSNRYTPR